MSDTPRVTAGGMILDEEAQKWLNTLSPADLADLERAIRAFAAGRARDGKNEPETALE